MSDGATLSSVAVGPTGVWVAGYTRGTLQGQTNSGGLDAFVRRYDREGNEVWTLEFGTSADDSAWGIAAGPTGVYVLGNALANFPGRKSLWSVYHPDLFVAKIVATE